MTTIDAATKNLLEKNISNAKNIFEKNISHKQDLITSKDGLSLCYVLEGNIDSAEIQLQSSMANKKMTSLGYVALAMIQERKENYEEATKYFQQALEKDDHTLIYTLYSFGTYLIKRENYIEGIAMLLKANNINNKFWSIRKNLAIGYAWAGQKFKSLQEFFVAFLLKPSLENLNDLLGYFLRIFPIAIWLIIALLVLPVYILIVNPKSILALTFFVLVFFGINFFKYKQTKNKNDLVVSILIILTAVGYYFSDIRK